MAAVAAKTRYIPFHHLYFGRGQTPCRDLSEVRSAARQNDHTALAVVHPLSSRSLIDNPELITNNPLLQEKITAERYGTYVARLKDRLRATLGPIMIFVEKEMHYTLGSLFQGFEPRGPVVTVTTEDGHPTPIIPEIVSGNRAWELLAATISDFQIERLQLAGELAYTEGSKRRGCVNFAFNQLSALRAEVAIIPELTFPDVFVPKHSGK